MNVLGQYEREELAVCEPVIDCRLLHVDRPLRAAAEPGPVIDHPFDDQLRRERRDGEVETLDAERGNAEEHADQRGKQPAADQRQDPRQVEFPDQGRRGIGADRHEGGMADRDLSGIAEQDVQAERAEAGDADQVGDPDPVFRSEYREADEHPENDHRHGDPHERHSIERQVFAVGAFEGARFPVDHGRHTRSMIFLPNRP